jgi:hypothetical protein
VFNAGSPEAAPLIKGFPVRGLNGVGHLLFADVISIEGQTVAVWAAGATLGTGTACRVHAPITVLTIANNMIAIDVRNCLSLMIRIEDE